MTDPAGQYTEPARDETLALVLWTLALAVPLLVLFAPVLNGYVLDGMIDRKEVTNPFHFLNLRTFQHGQFPQWDPYQFNGLPISYTGIDLALNPLNWPLYFFGSEDTILSYLTWLQIVKHLAMGVFATFFFRRVIPSLEGAVFAALAYSWSAGAVWATITSELTTFMFLPLGMYLLRLAVERLCAWHVAVFGVILAIDVVGDYYQWTFFMWLFWTAYAVYLSFGSARLKMRVCPALVTAIPIPLVLLGYGSALAAFLSMPKIFPFFMGLRSGEIIRGHVSPGNLDNYFTPLIAYVRLISANLLGHITHPDYPLAFIEGVHSNYVETMLGYAGILTLALAVLAVAVPTVRSTVRFPAAVIIIVLLILPRSTLGELMLKLTNFQIIYSRLAVYLGFFLAWLGGAALAHVVGLLDSRRARITIMVFTAAVLALLAALTIEFYAYRQGTPGLFIHPFSVPRLIRDADFYLYYWRPFRNSAVLALSLMVLALISAELLRRRIIAARAFQLMIIVATGIELLFSAARYEVKTYFSFLVPAQGLYASNLALDRIQEEFFVHRNFRLADFRYATLFRNPFPVTNSNTIYNIPQVSGFTSTTPARLAVLALALDGNEHAFRTIHVKDRLAYVSAAAYAQAIGPEFRFTPIKNPQPRARLLDRYTLAKSSADALDAIRAGHDLVASPIIVANESGLPPEGKSDGEVTWHNSPLNDLSMTVRTERSALLYIADSFYQGWTATVEGRPVPIYEANYAFMALPVPPGNHEVRLSYRNPHLVPALAIAGAGLALVAGHVLFLVLRRRRH
ncbi:MAG: hypothetical protein EXR96_05430 [Nitrospiraceae bacterium]|nr:hypothetical protein [Nitrospiraceae bacterium]